MVVMEVMTGGPVCFLVSADRPFVHRSALDPTTLGRGQHPVMGDARLVHDVVPLTHCAFGLFT